MPRPRRLVRPALLALLPALSVALPRGPVALATDPPPCVTVAVSGRVSIGPAGPCLPLTTYDCRGQGVANDLVGLAVEVVVCLPS